MKFELAISLGNEAMQTPADVAFALDNLADKMRTGHYWMAHHGLIRDGNGRAVGGWMVVT